MVVEKRQHSLKDRAVKSCRHPYSKPKLQNFGLVSEVAAGGRGSGPETSNCNEGIKKKPC